MHYDLIHIGAGSYPLEGSHEFASLSKGFLNNVILVDPNSDALDRALEKCNRLYGFLGHHGALDPSVDVPCKKEITVPLPHGDEGDRWEIASFSERYQQGRECKKVLVSVQSVKDFIEEYDISAIDRLIVDVEALDYEIVGGFLDEGIQPPVIIWEYINLGDKRIWLQDRLSDLGYIHTTLDGRNRLSVKV